MERLLKKISKKNTKGETPLHTAAIRGSSRLGTVLSEMPMITICWAQAYFKAKISFQSKEDFEFVSKTA